MSRLLKPFIIRPMSVILCVGCIVTYICAATPLFKEYNWESRFGDGTLYSRGVSRVDKENDEYSLAFAYTSVNEVIGQSAYWYAYAAVHCEPSDPNHQSDYKVRVSMLYHPVIPIVGPHVYIYDREASEESVQGIVSRDEMFFMYLSPLPDNIDEVNIEHCFGEARINGLKAKIPEYDFFD